MVGVRHQPDLPSLCPPHLQRVEKLRHFSAKSFSQHPAPCFIVKFTIHECWSTAGIKTACLALHQSTLPCKDSWPGMSVNDWDELYNTCMNTHTHTATVPPSAARPAFYSCIYLWIHFVLLARCGTSDALLFVCICNPPCDSLRQSWRGTRQSRLHTSIAVEFLLQPLLTWVCRRNSPCDLGTAVSWWEGIGRRSRYSRAAAPGPGSLETSGHRLMAVRARSVVGHWEEC